MHKKQKINKMILDLVRENGAMRVHDLFIKTGLSKQFLHRELLKLLEEEKIKKMGRAPKVFYIAQEIQPSMVREPEEFHNEKIKFLEKHFLFIRETGERITGLEAMRFWCIRHNLPLGKTIDEYIATRKKYLIYINENGLIDGMEKLKNTKGFSATGPDALFYLDFYATERFGKTKLGTLLHFAKQGQNKTLMEEIVNEIMQPVHRFIKREKTDAVAFIPPTIKRNLQFMKFLEKKLALPLPHINIVKVSGEIIVPQKALSKIEDRIANARATLFPVAEGNFRHILLIDDAVGSGASMNETALKLKEKFTDVKITALAVTGSYKGFDVISEV